MIAPVRKNFAAGLRSTPAGWRYSVMPACRRRCRCRSWSPPPLDGKSSRRVRCSARIPAGCRSGWAESWRRGGLFRETTGCARDRRLRLRGLPLRAEVVPVRDSQRRPDQLQPRSDRAATFDVDQVELAAPRRGPRPRSRRSATFAAFFGHDTQIMPSRFSAAWSSGRPAAISAWLTVKAWIRSNRALPFGFHDGEAHHLGEGDAVRQRLKLRRQRDERRDHARLVAEFVGERICRSSRRGQRSDSAEVVGPYRSAGRRRQTRCES